MKPKFWQILTWYQNVDLKNQNFDSFWPEKPHLDIFCCLKTEFFWPEQLETKIWTNFDLKKSNFDEKLTFFFALLVKYQQLSRSDPVWIDRWTNQGLITSVQRLRFRDGIGQSARLVTFDVPIVCIKDQRNIFFLFFFFSCEFIVRVWVNSRLSPMVTLQLWVCAMELPASNTS